MHDHGHRVSQAKSVLKYGSTWTICNGMYMATVVASVCRIPVSYGDRLGLSSGLAGPCGYVDGDPQSDSQPLGSLRYDVPDSRPKQRFRAKIEGDDTRPGGQGNKIEHVKRHVNTLRKEHQTMPRSGKGVIRGSGGEKCP